MYFGIHASIGRTLPREVPARLKDEVDSYIQISIPNTAKTDAVKLGSRAEMVPPDNSPNLPPRETQLKSRPSTQLNESYGNILRSMPSPLFFFLHQRWH